MSERIVPSADLIPEVPGARLVVQREGGVLPDGFWRVLYCVIDASMTRNGTVSGLKRDEDGWPWDILLVAPMTSQHWWERYNRWRLTHDVYHRPLKLRRPIDYVRLGGDGL